MASQRMRAPAAGWNSAEVPGPITRWLRQPYKSCFTAWRQRARLLRALEMLADDVPATTIALQLGYSTPSTFIALFERTFAATPAVYRQRLASVVPASSCVSAQSSG